jgi:hypothetical protein
MGMDQTAGNSFVSDAASAGQREISRRLTE